MLGEAWDATQSGWKTPFAQATPPIKRVWPNPLRWDHYADVLPALGDIAFFVSDGFVGRQIRDETHSWVNHVARIVGFDSDGCPILMDAQPKRVQLRRLDAYVDNFVAIYSPTCSRAVRYEIVEKTKRYELDIYGFGKIALIKLSKLFPPAASWCTLDNFPICSYSVAVPAFEVGQTFGVEPRSATPAHLWNYVRAHPEHYTRLRPLSLMEPLR